MAMHAKTLTNVPRWPRQWAYLLAGVALAMGAPAGLLVLRAFAEGVFPSLGWIEFELQDLALTYTYLTFTTAAVFGFAGAVLGRKEDRLRELINTDELTGIANRRHFDQRLSEEVSRARRYGSPLSVLVVDVDRLKQINDTEGHEAGDRALRAVAEALERSTRVSDLSARVGGDEFAMLAPSTLASDAVDLAERVRARLACTPYSISIGVAELNGGDAESLVARADRALYAAKDAGRGCTALAD